MTTPRTPLHLDDEQLQSLAEGSLRGPAGLAAREHCDTCAECADSLETYRALCGRLDALTDPPAPAEFTSQLLELISAQDEQLAAQRHIYLAAIPALLVAALAVLGWSWSIAPGQRLNALVRDLALCRQLLAVAQPALETMRVPLAMGALLACAAVGVLLVRTLRAPVRTHSALVTR